MVQIGVFDRQISTRGRGAGQFVQFDTGTGEKDFPQVRSEMGVCRQWTFTGDEQWLDNGEQVIECASVETFDGQLIEKNIARTMPIHRKRENAME